MEHRTYLHQGDEMRDDINIRISNSLKFLLDNSGFAINSIVGYESSQFFDNLNPWHPKAKKRKALTLIASEAHTMLVSQYEGLRHQEELDTNEFDLNFSPEGIVASMDRDLKTFITARRTDIQGQIDAFPVESDLSSAGEREYNRKRIRLLRDQYKVYTRAIELVDPVFLPAFKAQVEQASNHTTEK